MTFTRLIKIKICTKIIQRMLKYKMRTVQSTYIDLGTTKRYNSATYIYTKREGGGPIFRVDHSS